MIKADDGAVCPTSETDSAEERRGGAAGMSPTTYTTRHIAHAREDVKTHALAVNFHRAPGTRIGISMKSQWLCAREGHKVCR